jgi:hypothetical protein
MNPPQCQISAQAISAGTAAVARMFHAARSTGAALVISFIVEPGPGSFRSALVCADYLRRLVMPSQRIP